jgi:hypothetical protein
MKRLVLIRDIEIVVTFAMTSIKIIKNKKKKIKTFNKLFKS